jgi:hypothetical protein
MPDRVPLPQRLIAGAALLLGIVLVYLPVVTSSFAYGDDFAIFFDGSSEFEEFVSAGRPGLVLADVTVHRWIREISHLKMLRAIAIAGAVLLASIYFFLARRWFHGPVSRLCFAIGIVTLPSVQEYIAGAHNWTFTTIAALSSMSAIVARYAFEIATTRKSQTFSLLLAFALMEAALLSYQPAAMWYWPATMFFVLDSRFLTSANYRRATLKVILAGLSFIALGFVAMKVVLFLSQVTIQDRGELATNPIPKLYWFVRMQLTQGLNLWQIYSGNRYLMLGTATLTALLVASGYIVESLCRLRAGGRNLAAWIGLQLICATVVLLASHCHWLVVVNMTQNYRVAGALCAAVLVAVAWSVHRIVASCCGPDRGLRLEVVLFVAVAILSMLKCQNNLQRYFIEPYGTGYRYVVASLRSQLSPESTHVHLIRQRREDGLVTEELTQPFGWPFSIWATDGLIDIALHDAGVAHRVEQITASEDGEPIPDSPGTIVVDMRKLADFRLE